MSQSPEEAEARPRFPFVAAALCAASVGAAGWLFFRYSYMWDVTPSDFICVFPRIDPRGHPMRDRYVRLRGVFHEDRGAHRGRVTEAPEGGHAVPVLLDWTEPLPEKDADAVLRGRVCLAWPQGSVVLQEVTVDCARGRWTGASIAGFVVGAWGAFVFAAAFRHWLSLRRARLAGTGHEET